MLTLYIIVVIFSIIGFITLHIYQIYQLDMDDKDLDPKPKLINLKGFRYFFVFDGRKEGKMSLVPFVYAITAYITFAAKIVFATVWLITESKRYFILFLCIWALQTILVAAYIVYGSINAKKRHRQMDEEIERRFGFGAKKDKEE